MLDRDDVHPTTETGKDAAVTYEKRSVDEDEEEREVGDGVEQFRGIARHCECHRALSIRNNCRRDSNKVSKKSRDRPRDTESGESHRRLEVVLVPHGMDDHDVPLGGDTEEIEF